MFKLAHTSAGNSPLSTHRVACPLLSSLVRSTWLRTLFWSYKRRPGPICFLATGWSLPLKRWFASRSRLGTLVALSKSTLPYLHGLWVSGPRSPYWSLSALTVLACPRLARRTVLCPSWFIREHQWLWSLRGSLSQISFGCPVQMLRLFAVLMWARTRDGPFFAVILRPVHCDASSAVIAGFWARFEPFLFSQSEGLDHQHWRQLALEPSVF